MNTILQILFVLVIIIVIILFVFVPRIRTKEITPLPDNFRELLNDYVKFYEQLDEDGKNDFDKRLKQFLSKVRITGANAIVEDIDIILIGAGAIIPVYFIPDWEYVNLHEVLLYPGNFNHDFEQQGLDRTITGMVGTGPMQNTMIISKWELRQGFIDRRSNRNTAIHEFAHLIDKMDGTFDGVPEILLERKYFHQWVNMVNSTIMQMKSSESDIDYYGTTNQTEFFAVISEYYFEQPALLQANHPDLYEMLERIYKRKESKK
ncbi:MAG TPA: M90 family metallopeptidase [Chitinophagaceae bacterium]|nr:M90 family metallopeptidase [Chitinophagaceae bacterium]